MTDIVYVLGGGSTWENNEIRYSIRSVEKHLSNVRNIYIIGRDPGFLKDIIYIPFEDTHPCKETNIYRKVLRACQEESISDNFLFFNDDHFLIKDADADSYPFYYKGELIEVVHKLRDHNKYRMFVERTLKVLRERELPEKNFDTHTPILYNKASFIEVMSKYDWENQVGFVVKSLYSNSLRIEGQYERDCKINSRYSVESYYKIIEERKVFSIGNRTLGGELTQVLNQLYPNPSRYEV